MGNLQHLTQTSGVSPPASAGRRTMKLFGALFAFALALILLTLGTVLGFAVERQLGQDRRCVAIVRKLVGEIETLRTQNGRLPELHELHYGGTGLYAIRSVTAPSASKLPSQAYELDIWRGEWTVTYSSLTGEDTCDSKIIRLFPVLAILLFGPGLALIWWGGRAMRRAIRGG